MARAELLNEEHFALLNSLALKKMATSAALAEAARMPVGDAERILAELEAGGAVERAGEDLIPTELGAARVKDYADATYRPLRTDPAVERWAARFDAVDRRFRATILSWETVDVGGQSVANDHRDADYDSRVIGRIDALLVRGDQAIEELAQRVPRLLSYRDRLDAAFRKVDQGDVDYLSDAAVDSVLTIWVEMHEDFLQILGKQRAEAPTVTGRDPT